VSSIPPAPPQHSRQHLHQCVSVKGHSRHSPSGAQQLPRVVLGQQQRFVQLQQRQRHPEQHLQGGKGGETRSVWGPSTIITINMLCATGQRHSNTAM
jgi:hypothetical protein